MTIFAPLVLLVPLFAQGDASPFQAEPTAETQPPAATTIEVTLANGQRFVAELDPAATGEELRLRWRRGHMSLTRHIAWADVEQAVVAGQKLSGAQFRDLVQQARAEVPKPPLPQRVVLESGRNPAFARPSPAASSVSAPSDPRVRAIDVEAAVANWDGDVEVDGLVLWLVPRDEFGELVPVSGTLVVELQGEHSGVVRMPQPFVNVGSWTVSVRPKDFGPRGAAYKLPFQNVHPEFDAALLPRGLVHARLSVPGQGTFEAADAMVRIRPYSSVRDRLQQSNGRRFFPNETTGDGRH